MRKEEGNIKITEVKVINEKGANSIGKPIGSYITIDINKLKLATDEDIENLRRSMEEDEILVTAQSIQELKYYIAQDNYEEFLKVRAFIKNELQDTR